MLNKTQLIELVTEIQHNSYASKLYFIKIDRRKKEVYTSHLVKFKSEQNINDYKRILMNYINSKMLDKIEEVQDYNGFNTKISCDKLALDNPLIKDNYNLLENSINRATENNLEKRYNFYILSCQRKENDIVKNIFFGRVCNPTLKLEKGRNIVFKKSLDDENSGELEDITDEMYKLNIFTDFIVYDDYIYTFNHSFEKIFDVELSINKITNLYIDKLKSKNMFNDNEVFGEKVKTTINKKQLLKLNQEKLDKLISDNELATVYKINKEDDKFELSDENIKRILDFACSKMIAEVNTHDIYTGDNLKKSD